MQGCYRAITGHDEMGPPEFRTPVLGQSHHKLRRTFLGNGSEGPKPEELMIKEEEEDNNNNNYTVISVSLISGADAF